MKTNKLILVLTILVLSACGGGGGSDGNACEQYCNFTCAKMTNCGFLHYTQTLDCNSACFAKTDELNRSEESCTSAQHSAQSMTCLQLGRTLGVAKTREQLSCEDIAFMIAEEN